MREFFKGWRRKAGCVTLVMACAACVMWMRSFNADECLRFPIGDRQHVIYSNAGVINWIGFTSDQTEVRYLSDASFFASIGFMRIFAETNLIIFSEWTFSYWLITLPMTLLSAYLLLSKPRKTPKPGSVTNA